MTSRGRDGLFFHGYKHGLHVGLQHFTLTIATIKLCLLLLSLRVERSFLVLLSCWNLTRGSTPASAYGLVDDAMYVYFCILHLILLNQACITCFHFYQYIKVNRTEHSANPDKFVHMLQQSHWRSPRSLVVWLIYELMDLMWTRVTRWNPSKCHIVTDLLLMQTHIKHGALHLTINSKQWLWNQRWWAV